MADRIIRVVEGRTIVTEGAALISPLVASAANSAATALAAASEAAIARDVAVTEGPVFYATIAAGEAATATDAAFAVATGDGYVSWYRRTSGGSLLIFQALTKEGTDSLSIGATEIKDAAPGDPFSAILFRPAVKGRRGETQVSPNDGDGTNNATERDQFAGGEVTAYGYDLRGSLGAANNIAYSLRYARVGGVCVSVDIATFAPGSTPDVPFRLLNENAGYHTEWGTNGRVNFRLGITSGGPIDIAGDGSSVFSAGNPLPAFRARGDSPAYDLEEWTTDGLTRINGMRFRLIGGKLYLSTLNSSGDAVTNPIEVGMTGAIVLRGPVTINSDNSVLPDFNIGVPGVGKSQPAVDFNDSDSGKAVRFRVVNGIPSLYWVDDGIVPFDFTASGGPIFRNIRADTTTGNSMDEVRYDTATSELVRFAYTPPTLAADATDLATAITLVNQLKALEIARGRAV